MASTGKQRQGDISQELREAVKGSRWSEVITAIQSDDCSKELRQWLVRKTVVTAPDKDMAEILQVCAKDQPDWVFTHLLKRRMWTCVDLLLQQKVSRGGGHHTRVIQEALKYCTEEDFAKHILHYCTEQELQHVSTLMASQGLWKPVSGVTSGDVGVTQHVLSQLVCRGLWEAVTRFVQRDISSEQHRWAMVEASKHASDVDLFHYIVPACHGEELDEVVTHLASRGLWMSVGKALEQGVSSEQQRWTVEQAGKHADKSYLLIDILPRCQSQDLELILTHLVSRGLWTLAGKVLERGVSVAQHRWAVTQACQRAEDADILADVLPHCTDDELQVVITPLVSRGFWRTVNKVLQRGISSTQHRWAVYEAGKRAPEEVFLDSMLHHCAEGDLEETMTRMATRGLWEPVRICPNSDFSIRQRILHQLVSRGVWRAVGRFLKRGLGRALSRWAVLQASRLADDEEDVIGYILPQCHEEDLADVVTHLVSRGLWWSVREVLERGVGVMPHRWAVKQALKHAKPHDFVTYILPQCHHTDLNYVLTHLVSWHKWKAVGKVLKQGVSPAQHKWAIKQACVHAHADGFDLYLEILPHCHQEHLVDIVTHLMSIGMWSVVSEMLEKGVGTAQHRWVVEEASQRAGDETFFQRMIRQCRDDDLEVVLPHLVSRGLWKSAGKALERGVGTALHRWAVKQAVVRTDDDTFDRWTLHHCRKEDIVDTFHDLVANRKWVCTKHVLYNTIHDALLTWMTPQQDVKTRDTQFWNLILHCRLDASLALDLVKNVSQKIRVGSHHHSVLRISSDLAHEASSQQELCQSLILALLHTLCCVLCSEELEYSDIAESTKECVSDVYTRITDCIRDNADCNKRNVPKVTKRKKQAKVQTLGGIKDKVKWMAVFTEIADAHKSDPQFLLHFLQGLNLYYANRHGENDDSILLVILAVFPLFPQLQSAALQVMLRDRRWDVLSQACMSHVWEHDRRQLFKAAVEQKQWGIVRQWADHSLHDDQRDWAMKEAFREKQWQVYLLLADHGLTMQEHMHACYIVAKYGDWDTVLQMVERGGDVTEVSNLLETWVSNNLRKTPKGDRSVFERRCEKLIKLRLRFVKNAVERPEKSLQSCLWGSVLFNILHEPTEEFFSRVLHTVIEKRQWHILMHLVRLGMNQVERDWLFPQMVRQQQWGVCRKLLEIGVDVRLCLEALPELLEKNQWTLVARVMEYGADDAVRHQVMQCAFQRREGVLFWHCLATMANQEPMPVETRVRLFHHAISRDVWQAVKPLVEEKDDSGRHQRDLAFLEAIEQHLWDVVDHCQVLGADINMEDENGETPLHREARKKEWKAVEEIVFREGRPNMVDKDGVSVLNRLISHDQSQAAKFVIKYGGSIHLPAKWSEHKSQSLTPLQALIDRRQGDVIQFTVMWCPEQKKGVNERGETTLHALCASDRWDGMEDLLVRQVDPLAVTETGQTALVYAVLNKRHPQEMVTECCKLGFSSHQPPLAGNQDSLPSDIIDTVIRMWRLSKPPSYFHCDFMQRSAITSPLLCAALRDLPQEVLLLLFDSGSTSRGDLSTLITQLSKLRDLDEREDRTLYEKFLKPMHQRHVDSDQWLQLYAKLTDSVGKNIELMKTLATTPRTLLSLCRLLVLSRFHFSNKKRQECIQALPLPLPLRKYLVFSDYGDHQ